MAKLFKFKIITISNHKGISSILIIKAMATSIVALALVFILPYLGSVASAQEMSGIFSYPCINCRVIKQYDTATYQDGVVAVFRIPGEEEIANSISKNQNFVYLQGEQEKKEDFCLYEQLGYFFGISFTEAAKGDVIYYDGTDWVNLEAGASGHFLQTQGSGFDPQWTSVHSGDMFAVNNLSDLGSIITARTNLGLEINSDVQAYDIYLDDISSITAAQGDIMFFDGAGWVRLVAGTKGHVLQSQGAGANPQWAAAGNGTYQLTDLSDVHTATVTNGNILMADGADWESVAQTSITSLGTVVTGVWNGTVIDISDYTNLAGDGEIVLADDMLSISSGIARDNELHNPITLAGLDYLTLSDQQLTLETVDISDDTNLMGGTNLTINGDILNVDDAFLLNDGDIGDGDYAFSGTLDLSGTVLQSTNALVFEGLLVDDFETLFVISNPTVDRSIVFPDAGGEVSLLGQLVGTGELEDNSVSGSKVALGSDAEGDVMYYDGSDWVSLTAGING